MEVIIGGRASGKTTRLARRFHDLAMMRDAVLITPTRAERDHLCGAFGIYPSMIHTYNDVVEGVLRGRPGAPVYIDNLDAVLAGMFWPGTVDLATLTVDQATLLGGETT